METHEVVILETFFDRPEKDQRKIREAIVPCGVVWEKIPVVG